MIDIHAHILPGMDDGAEDLQDTIEMARIAVESGVTAMVATPHCNIPGIDCGKQCTITFFRSQSAQFRRTEVCIILPFFRTGDPGSVCKMKLHVVFEKNRVGITDIAGNSYFPAAGR